MAEFDEIVQLKYLAALAYSVMLHAAGEILCAFAWRHREMLKKLRVR